jgi:hypothetical protein
MPEYRITHRLNRPVSRVRETSWISEDHAKRFMLNPRVVILSFETRKAEKSEHEETNKEFK